MISLHGTPQQAGVDPAVVADPVDRTKIFSWLISEMRDPYGSRAVYEYVRDSLALCPRGVLSTPDG